VLAGSVVLALLAAWLLARAGLPEQPAPARRPEPEPAVAGTATGG
jgi:hypothetical protein